MGDGGEEERVRWNCFVDAQLSGDERARLEYRMRAFRSNVRAQVKMDDGGRLVAGFGREPVRFLQRSPLPGDSRSFGAVDFHLERYGVDDTLKQLLALAIDWPGVVGRTKFGWLFLKASRSGELRAATAAEVELLPHLPEDWEMHLAERGATDPDQEGAAFLALLAPYDLREGDDPTQPYSAQRGWIRRGWFGIVKELVEDLIALGWNRELRQVKEKFGTLRFHIGPCDEPLQERIIAAREHSAEVCELCGRGGSLRVTPRQWHLTRCDPCWEAELQQLAEDPHG